MKLSPNPKTLIFSKEKMNSQKISKVTSSFDEHFNNLLYQMFEVNQKEGIPLMIEKSDDITNYEGYKLKIEKEVKKLKKRYVNNLWITYIKGYFK